MRRTSVSFSLLVILPVLITGRATLFGPDSHPLALSSDQSGAEIYVNGFKRSTNPIDLSLKADRSYTIEFKKEGYHTVNRVVNPKVGAGWVVLDVIGGLIPVVIDAATENWNQLDTFSHDGNGLGNGGNSGFN